MNSSLPPIPPHKAHGSLADTLRALPAGAQPSDVWRSAASALLRLNPRECDALGSVFEDESTSDDTRSTVLDLLAGAGSFEAQVVIRRVLSLAVARRSSRLFATWVQSLGFVECPDGPTLRFLMSVYAESRNESNDVRAACAYALGAAAGHALAAGESEAAVRASDVIRRDLLGAAATLEKCALLTALGNAGVSSDVVVVTRFTQDREAAVRCAAALALRRMAVSDARVHLIAMLADRDVKVAQSAIIALADQKLEDAEVERIAELVLGGRSSLAIDAALLRMLVAQRPRPTSSSGRTGASESALRLLMGRVEAAGAFEPKNVGSGARRIPSGASFPALGTRMQSTAPAPPPPAPPAPTAVAAAALAKTVLGPLFPPAPAPPPVAQTPVASGSYRIVDAARLAATERSDAPVEKRGFDPEATIANMPPLPRRVR